jgi:hypothetical protein
MTCRFAFIVQWTTKPDESNSGKPSSDLSSEFSHFAVGYNIQVQYKTKLYISERSLKEFPWWLDRLSIKISSLERVLRKWCFKLSYLLDERWGNSLLDRLILNTHLHTTTKIKESLRIKFNDTNAKRIWAKSYCIQWLHEIMVYLKNRITWRILIE